jgi:hypothetical protein
MRSPLLRLRRSVTAEFFQTETGNEPVRAWL